MVKGGLMGGKGSQKEREVALLSWDEFQMILIKIKTVSMLACLSPYNLMNLQLLITQDKHLKIRIRLDLALVISTLEPSLILEDILERISLRLQTTSHSFPALDLSRDVDNLRTCANPIVCYLWLYCMRGGVSCKSIPCCISIWLGLMRVDRTIMFRINFLVLRNVIQLPSSSEPRYSFYQISIMLSLSKKHPSSTLILPKFHASKRCSDHTLTMCMFWYSSSFRPIEVSCMRGLP